MLRLSRIRFHDYLKRLTFFIRNSKNLNYIRAGFNILIVCFTGVILLVFPCILVAVTTQLWFWAFYLLHCILLAWVVGKVSKWDYT